MSDSQLKPSEPMLNEAASVCHLMGGMAAKHVILVGGLVPPLLVPEHANSHIGSADIDFCLSMAITDGRTGVYKSIEESISSYFELDGETGFRWRKKAGVEGLPVLLDFMAPDSETTPTSDGTIHVVDETAAGNMGSVLRPFPLRTGELLDLDADTTTLKGVQLTHRPGVKANVSLRHAGPVGLLSAKADALDGRDDTKDGYDIAWWCINAAATPDAAADLVLRRPAFEHPLFQESVQQLGSAFQEPDYQGPSGYAAEMHPDLAPGDREFELARNRAFSAVSRVTKILRAELFT